MKTQKEKKEQKQKLYWNKKSKGFNLITQLLNPETLKKIKCEQIKNQIKTEKNEITRINLAKDLLKFEPESVEALIVLGNESNLPTEALKYFKKALDIAKNFCKDCFNKFEGLFWLIPETQNFMKAKYAYAWCMFKRIQFIYEN
ncbi:protein st7 [Anaeramoeba ignava]|uniref:Protein st7 n=1 Tax=Anaeramoeba ignava TaxID=1746090 RepID=A0A9Q0LUP7_ANAIG|nr:protein st7 [Anaeramoeba ignava]